MVASPGGTEDSAALAENVVLGKPLPLKDDLNPLQEAAKKVMKGMSDIDMKCKTKYPSLFYIILGCMNTPGFILFRKMFLGECFDLSIGLFGYDFYHF